jgi:hypothetical protein
MIREHLPGLITFSRAPAKALTPPCRRLCNEMLQHSRRRRIIAAACECHSPARCVKAGEG